MKRKSFVLGLVGTLLLTTALLAQPRARSCDPEMRMHKMLELTDDQEAKMQELKLDFEREVLPLKSKLQSLKADPKLEMTAEKFDEGKANKLVEEMQKVRTDMQKKHIRHEQKVRAILTPEQRQKFDLHVMSDKGPRGGHGECGMSGHSGPGQFGHHGGGPRP